MMESLKFKSTCCNPFKKSGHLNARKNLRNVLPWMIEKMPDLSIKEKICAKCRKNLKFLESPGSEKDCTLATASGSYCDADDKLYDSSESYEKEVSISTLNKSLQNIGESPVRKKRLNEFKYSKLKMKKISKALKKKVLKISSESDSFNDLTENEIITQLKDKFKMTTDRSMKVQILTILPKSWSIKRIEKEFGTSNFMARQAKQLVKDKGILSSPNPKPGKNLNLKTVNLIKEFYNRDDISRMMPGKKDFVSMKIDGVKTHVQKRLVLCNLNELYKQFKDEFPELKLGFSKFCEIRPKNCILAGASGTHSVCVCHIHQNIKLMLIGCNLSEFTKNEETHISSYKTCIAKMICNPPQPICYFKECLNCLTKSDELKELIEKKFDDNNIQNVTYKQWVNVDRSTLETMNSTSDSFIELLIEKLTILLRHSFVAVEQSSFFNDAKHNLKKGEFVIICDFSENYSFILQDEIQGFHWNNSQTTIHPFVIYLNRGDKSQTNEHLSFVIISECLHHDTFAVHLFQKRVIKFLQRHLDQKLKKITYFSDGAAAHYKNRNNFLNLLHHSIDFGVKAEWHFFATAHGKSACDGVGGTIKRLAARASLQRPYVEQIMTPRQLYEWASSNIAAMHFDYVTEEEYQSNKKLLNERFSSAHTIPGTQKLHAFVPSLNNKMFCKIYSNCETGKEAKVIKKSGELEFEDITGFVTCAYDGHWWVGCVLNSNAVTDSVKISLLHPHGPAPYFAFPESSDILDISPSDILTKVDVRTATGCTYMISSKEKIKANQQLNCYLELQNRFLCI